MEKVLIVVDMQNDFIDGTLGTKEAQEIVPKVVDKINNWDGKVLYTYDSHEENYLETQEGKKLPIKHCIHHTEGWKINKDVRKAIEDHNGAIYENKYYLKNAFGSIELAEDLSKESEKIESITLIGLCTGICVLSNAILIKSFCPEIPIIVDSSCCACVTKESHKNALEAMKTCQIEVI